MLLQHSLAGVFWALQHPWMQAKGAALSPSCSLLLWIIYYFGGIPKIIVWNLLPEDLFRHVILILLGIFAKQ